ncbi:acetylornithine aminotransferase [Polycladomyces abyssicola]|uniref:Acetylornithine aminotransferase n=1 Tax=Polycladomyces abyssicola TaxID=1125966 RepID=A0A8D5UK32_9BACL|nr:acetylornithine transaminase [Polycladomyces abyssicola]BCU83185.1 acetylornithine aminotransferase [Polycladomyces abyssicola]
MALFPTYTRVPVRVASGSGSILLDEDGKRYLDFTSGLGVCNLGHCHTAVTTAVEAQLRQLWHVSNLFHIPLQEQVADLLVQASGLGAVFFCNSGAEANEAAIKLARKYAREKRGIERPIILTFRKSFHGRTLATLTATGQDKVKTGFDPLPEGFVYATYNDLGSVEEALTPDVAGVFLELVQGEGGVRPADPAFVEGLARLCADKGVLLMVDEVQTGIGRTGKLFACEHYGIVPDIMTLAKGLGNGMPVGAMLAKAEYAGVFGPGSHASTFGGNPLAMAAARAVLTEMKQSDVLSRAAEHGTWLITRLKEKLEGRPGVVEVRGLGLMIGIELNQPVAQVIEAARQRGLLVSPAGPQVVRLLPPLVTERTQLEEAVDILTAALEEVEKGESVSGVGHGGRI